MPTRFLPPSATPTGPASPRGARPPDAPLGRGDGRGTRPAARTRHLRLRAGLQPRRRDAGVRLRRLHGPPVGHGAAEDALPGAPRGRSAATPGRTAGRAIVAGEER